MLLCQNNMKMYYHALRCWGYISIICAWKWGEFFWFFVGTVNLTGNNFWHLANYKNIQLLEQRLYNSFCSWFPKVTTGSLALPLVILMPQTETSSKKYAIVFHVLASSTAIYPKHICGEQGKNFPSLSLKPPSWILSSHLRHLMGNFSTCLHLQR